MQLWQFDGGGGAQPRSGTKDLGKSSSMNKCMNNYEQGWGQGFWHAYDAFSSRGFVSDSWAFLFQNGQTPPKQGNYSNVRNKQLQIKQESPADAVKPARRKSMQKLLQFDVLRFISPNSISPNFKV